MLDSSNKKFLLECNFWSVLKLNKNILNIYHFEKQLCYQLNIVGDRNI